MIGETKGSEASTGTTTLTIIDQYVETWWDGCHCTLYNFVLYDVDGKKLSRTNLYFGRVNAGGSFCLLTQHNLNEGDGFEVGIKELF